MGNRIQIDLNRTLGQINRDIFGGFAEHYGRCIYGGIFEPGSPLADTSGLRLDVLEALRRMRMPVMRYPGGNFVSGYRWMDGVGPVDERPARSDLAWGALEPNQFGTNEFIAFCRLLGTEPYLAVNCGDGDMREARDWVEYCNGTRNTSLANLRRQHGFEEPHRVKYWSIGNEVDGPWQIGFKTPGEYARAYTEYAKAMRWVDPSIKLLASAVSLWEGDFVERAQLLIEQAGNMIDYMALHWYVENQANDFARYMTVSEQVEGWLASYEGLIRALRLDNALLHPIYIAVDEWNVWYRTHPGLVGGPTNAEEVYNLEDALVVAMQINAFIRHCRTVQMANIAQVVNVISPILTNPQGLVLQTTFYPFELYSGTCGPTALDVWWDGDTFDGGLYSGVRTLDVAATYDDQRKQVVLYVVNRSQTEQVETTIKLADGEFAGPAQATIINGPHIKAINSFEEPYQVTPCEESVDVEGGTWNYAFEPHSVTALICPVR